MSLSSRMAAVLALVVVATGCSQSPPPARPNIVLVVIDTLRADHLGSYGYARAETPKLDAFAAQGLRFAAAHAPSSWTLPSVASILTGRYPVEHGVERVVNALNEKQVTIAEVLRDAGYETAAFSANVALVIEASGFAQGFDHFQVLEVAAADQDPNTDAVLVRDGTERSAQAATANVVTDAALAWLAARTKPQQPYFLYVHYFDPHVSYSPPEKYMTRFGVRADDPIRHGQGLLMLAGKPPPPPQLATLQALYDGEIAFTDAEVGRLLDAVHGGPQPDPVILLTADHGEEFGDHGGLQHGHTLYEEVLHVPLLVTGPGLAPGRVIEPPVSLVSIAPTLAELGGANAAAFPSASLVPVLRGGVPKSELSFADLASATSPHRCAVIDGTWKLTLNKNFTVSLFDLSADPGERENRSDREPDVTRRLQKAIGEHTRDGMKRRGAAPPLTRELDADRTERLRALGYVQ